MIYKVSINSNNFGTLMKWLTLNIDRVWFRKYSLRMSQTHNMCRIQKMRIRINEHDTFFKTTRKKLDLG